uniref:MSP domain-containing protein n=1 Tax=Heterorhabditis bacteriophora TaxID=37862 RepID=A0A1I7WAP1_HETBA
MGLRWFFLPVILSFISAVLSTPEAKEKSVIVSVNAKWTMTSLIAETRFVPFPIFVQVCNTKDFYI